MELIVSANLQTFLTECNMLFKEDIIFKLFPIVPKVQNVAGRTVIYLKIEQLIGAVVMFALGKKVEFTSCL